MNLELCSWQSPSYLALSTGSWRLPEEPRRRRGIPLDSKASLDSLWLFRRLQLSSLPALTPWSPTKPSSWPWGTAAVHNRARFLGARRATCLYYSRQVPPVGCSARPSLWFNDWEEQTLAWLVLHFSSRLNLLTELQTSCQFFFEITFWNSSQAVFKWVGHNI